jgi:hypothetical protein
MELGGSLSKPSQSKNETLFVKQIFKKQKCLGVGGAAKEREVEREGEGGGERDLVSVEGTIIK